MKLLLRSEIIKSIPQEWRKEWPEENEIYKKLLAEKCLTEEIAEKIIGNPYWSELECDECKEQCEIAVQLGEEPDYESSTATVCVKCLESAINLVRKK